MEKSYSGKKSLEVRAKGELSLYHLDKVISLLGREGLSEVSVIYHEQEPSLGTITYEEMRNFTINQSGLNPRANLDSKLWNGLAKESNASKSRYSNTDLALDDVEPRGSIEIGSELIQVFEIAEEAELDAHVGFHSRDMAEGYELRLDGVNKLLGMGVLGNITNLGDKTVELAKLLVQSRQ